MRIEKSLITIIIAFILTSCSGSVNYTNSSEPAKDNDEYFEFDTSQLEKFRFIEDAIENAVKYPPYYDNRVGNWHSYAGDKFENEPYYAEGYIVHNSEFPTTDIPSNIWVIENYQNNTDVLFALDFADWRTINKPREDELIQVYGLLSGMPYTDYVLNMRVSGEIPEVIVNIIKIDGEVVYDNTSHSKVDRIAVGEEEDTLKEMLSGGWILKALHLYQQLNATQSLELDRIVNEHFDTLNKDYNEKLIKYSNPFSDYYDIELTKYIIDSYSFITNDIESTSFIENIEDIRNLLRSKLNNYDDDIEEYWPDEAEEKTSQFYDVKLEIRKKVESACYFNDLVCDELSGIVSDEYYNVFEFYLSETDGFREGEKRTTKLSQKNGFQHPTIFFSIPWAPYNGTMPFLLKDYIINKSEDVYEFARIETTQNFKYYARILK